MQKFPRITLRRLEVFVAVAESGGFRTAADQLDMAQPSVSGHIQALESQAGGALFERRRGRGVDLTDLGKTFLKHARQLLTEADNMAIDLNRARSETERRIVFACQRSLSDFLPPLVAKFAGEHREIELITRVGRQEDVFSLIHDGGANLGLYLGSQEPEGTRSIKVGRQELAIVASRNHPLAHRSDIAPAELNDHDFVGPPEGSMFGQGIAEILAAVGAEHITVVSKATEFEYLRALALASVGLYCCVRRRIQPDLDSGALAMVRLNAPPLTMEIRLVFSLKRPISPPVALFGEFLRKHLYAEHRRSDGGQLAVSP